MKQIILTNAALEKLKIELSELKEKRKELAERIERAREFGDLSENFEYHEAKDAQGMNEARINELNTITKTAIIQEKTCEGGAIEMGSEIIVEVNNLSHKFTIVSFNEADPSKGKISNESPIGSALIGHCENDEVIVQTPGGSVKYKIISVK